MTRRDSSLPLLLSAAAAVALHAALVPAMSLYGWAGGALQSLAKIDAPIEPPEEPAEEEPTVGREDSKASAVAWISHEDFRELMARQAPTEQPALQQMIDPVAEAPPELDPTPPAPQAAPAPQATATPEATPAPALRPPAPPGRPQPFRLDETGGVRVPFAPTPLLAEAPRPQPPEATPAAEAAAATPPPTAADPTASLRSDRESPPTRLEPFEWFQAGSVPVSRGIEVKTIAPRFSVVAQYSVPHNPELVVHFDRTGQVLRVELVKSSGFENVDAPVLAALYRWRATGERIDALGEGETLELPVRMYLRRKD